MRAERSAAAGAAPPAAGAHRAPAEFIDRFKAKASKAKQAQSRVKALERMGKARAGADAERLQLRVPRALSPANPMLSFDGVACGCPPRRGRRRQPARHRAASSRSVLAGQRIGILGANGQGKVDAGQDHRACCRRRRADRRGKGLAIGYFAQQELDVLRPTRAAGAPGPPRAGRRPAGARAGTARLPRHLPLQRRDGATGRGQPCSPAAKARLVLAMLVWQRPNLLLLDEPTNHLDLRPRGAVDGAQRVRGAR